MYITLVRKRKCKNVFQLWTKIKLPLLFHVGNEGKNGKKDWVNPSPSKQRTEFC